MDVSITPYFVGNILGRLTFSWIVVAIIYLLIYRFRWKAALKRSFWPWGWMWVILLFVMPSKKIIVACFTILLTVTLTNVYASADTTYNPDKQACGHHRPPSKNITGSIVGLQKEIQEYTGDNLYTEDQLCIAPGGKLGQTLSNNFVVAEQFLPSQKRYNIYAGMVPGTATCDTLFVTSKRGEPVLVGEYGLGYTDLNVEHGKLVSKKIDTIVHIFYRQKKDLQALSLVKDLATSFTRFSYDKGRKLNAPESYLIYLYDLKNMHGCENINGRLTLKGCYHKTITGRFQV